MKRKINAQCDHMIIFYMSAILLFAMIFPKELMGSFGVVAMGNIFEVWGYCSIIFTMLVMIISFGKAVFEFKILKIKKPILTVMALLFVAALVLFIDTIIPGEKFGGSLATNLIAPITQVFGELGSTVIFGALTLAFLVLTVNQVFNLYGINLFKLSTAKYKEGKASEFRTDVSNDQFDDDILIKHPRLKAAPSIPLLENDAGEKEYNEPSINLLAADADTVQVISRSESKQKASIIESVFSAMKIEAKVTDVIVGSSVIRYEVAVANSADIMKVNKAATALQSRLEVEKVNIEAPIAGKDRVGVELPNPYPQTVGLKNLISSQEFKQSSVTTVALGQDITGGIILCDIAKMPHLLVAGSTGAGKSVCLNTIILSMIYHSSPSDLKLILIDPKKVEFAAYKDIPHLLQDIVTNDIDALTVLREMTEEVERRYSLFAEESVKDLNEYNDVAGEKLPRVVVIIDELADLMQVSRSREGGEGVEFQIQRISQKARAAGVHLVIATQRPSVNVITGVIKANLPSRIAFKLSNGVDSRTILDESGAENLIGNGDMFYKPAHLSNKLRVQGAYVSGREIAQIVAEVKLKNPRRIIPQEAEVVISDVCSEDTNLTQGIAEDVRPYSIEEEFCDFVSDKQSITIEAVQAEFEVGYSTAYRMIEVLVNKNVLVSVDDETFDNIKLIEK